ncbi:uncharacterized protein LOC119406790 [Rhipicephalus sanguineus]|uniref:uncharacterized protein LOC119406790 n=1 Tax=Rhipicephalus sanguineus TaxID=34632 RepID=UPI001892EEE9|nr:uncharacterized protein LOC119406790 [Rhipicephalus sanguineus]
MRSVGADTAAQMGRGNRIVAEDEQDYEVVLPQLPTGACVMNTVFLHGDIKARPYRVEDVRDTLVSLGMLPEVLALGAFQMNHVWAVTFSTAQATKKMLALGDVKIKERRCLVIDPNKQDVRLKLYWLLHNVPDEDVRTALANYGRVTEVSKERWRVQGIADKGTSTRTVTLQLKAGLTVEDLPHQLRVGGITTLLVVPGRAPLCLRCRRTGHIRRDCRIPRCGRCRRYGHEDSECAQTYASVAGPVAGDHLTEHIMDQADAEEAAESRNRGPIFTPLSKGPKDEGSEAAQAEQTGQQTNSVSSIPRDQSDNENEQGIGSSTGQPEDMDVTRAGTSAKRTLEDVSNEDAEPERTTGGEPATKAATLRRPSLRFKPNIAAGTRPPPKPPS